MIRRVGRQTEPCLERWASGHEGTSEVAKSWHAAATHDSVLWDVRCSFCRVLAISADRRSLRCQGASTAAAKGRGHLRGMRSSRAIDRNCHHRPVAEELPPGYQIAGIHPAYGQRGFEA